MAGTVFLDRDGVINRNRSDYVKSWDEFQFLPHAASAIARLTQAGYRLFVVTNQACIDKGLVPSATVDDIHCRMVDEIARSGGRIEAVLCCPHQQERGCDCRKPAPGLLLRAQRDFGVDLSQAILVGDSISDMRAATEVGIPSILVLSGLGWRTAVAVTGDVSGSYRLALDLAHAARLIGIGPSTPLREPRWLRGIVAGARTVRACSVAWTSERR